MICGGRAPNLSGVPSSSFLLQYTNITVQFSSLSPVHHSFVS